MLSFDYIADEGLRESLESDFNELERSHANSNWKSVLVLAGSIVEALLVDTLLSVPGFDGKDPLGMQLAQAVDHCVDEKIISQRAADLCSVVRSYRNLIHPGRLVRLGEALPDADSAVVAVALVRLIAHEVSQKRRVSIGLTADQVLSKILRDQRADTILKHLLNEVSEKEKRRLLLELLPAEHEKLDWADDQSRLASAFRAVLDAASKDTKGEVATRAVAVIREGDGSLVERYIKSFFVASDLEFIAVKDRPMVIDHLLAMATPKQPMSQDMLNVWNGLYRYLDKVTIRKWVDEFLRCIILGQDRHVSANARVAFTFQAADLDDDLKSRLDERMQNWRTSLAKNPSAATQIDSLAEQIELNRDIPF